MNKAQFFHKPCAREITRGKTAIEADSDLLKIVESLQNDNERFLRIKSPLHSFKTPKKFLRHGPELRIEMPSTIRDHIKERKKPVDHIIESMEKMENYNYACYSYIPLKTNDKTPRKIFPVNCVDGAKLYTYMQKNSTNIKIRDFSTSLRTDRDGAQMIVSVPSMTPKEKNYNIKFILFPVIDNENKYGVAYSLRTEGHDCMDSLITNISFNLPYFKRDSHFVSFCDHEIAAYFYLIDYFKNEKRNLVPMDMCPFLILTNYTTQLKKTIENKVVIEKLDIKGEPKDYPLDEADEDIFYWMAIKEHGPIKTFYRKATEDGLLKDDPW